MNRTNFFNGMDISADDLQYSQAALIQQIKDSRTDIIGKGVLSGINDYVQLDSSTLSDGTPTIRILPFTAYNHIGERIESSPVFGLALDLTDPSNRQLGEQGELPLEDFGWEAGATYQICAKYIERGARPLPQDITAIPYPSRIYSGFSFYALRKGVDSLIENGVNPYIILAEAIYTEDTTGKNLQITNKGITQYSVISGSRIGAVPTNTKTQVYDPQNLDNSANPTEISFDDHIHAIDDVNAVSATNPHGITAETLGVDTKSVPTHERLFHSNGLLAGSAGVSTTTSGFYTTVVPRVSLVDYLKIYNLASDELLHYNGATLKYAINSSISSFNISLEDNNGIWPDGIYSLYVSTATNNLFICVPNSSTAVNRTYTIYNGLTNDALTTAKPIIESDVDTSIHYLLYSFKFSNVKGISTVYNPSNFISLTDYRTFGSISANNLQRTAQNIFSLPYTVKVSEILFSDNSSLITSNGILKYTNISNCIVVAPNGSFVVGSGADANKIIIKAGLSLLCANGLTSDGTCNSVPTRYTVNTTSLTGAPSTKGKYYVFVGQATDDLTQQVYFSDNYIISDTTPIAVTGSNPSWYNPDLNEIRFYSNSAWGSPIVLAKIGYVVVDAGGNISEVNPDSPVKLLDYSNFDILLQKLDYVVESYQNPSGTSGYMVYKSGKIDQWGYKASDGNTTTVTLLKPFSSINYVPLTTIASNNDTLNGYGYVKNLTTTTFQVVTFSGCGIYWRAVGQGA